MGLYSTFSVLCVEDNEANMLVVQRIVESKAFELLKAQTAEEGIALAHKHHPNLILMDIHLPGMDGFEATRLMKLDHSLRDTPIIAVTADTNYSKSTCLAAGVADLPVKPLPLAKV